ncbi:hypothetical protein CDD81_1806 [Ophiocordyceps australis]|uniref:Uncharacterized protein n=1 Tax=Ophiocordyceps australis TaxID=1399860 RepID=A0A2C5XF62_9HYPO|nr:hypothetical protein CDD81_1806 [Ophiocordyceps australis]
MPQDPNLYGQRPAKKQKTATSLSTSLDFTAQLTSIMSTSSSTAATSSGRPRPSREARQDIFRSSKPTKSKTSQEEQEARLVLKEVAGTEEETAELARARRKMEVKARQYAAMKRGDYVPKENEAEPLVDFDRKWAESKEQGVLSSDDDSDEDSNDGGDEVVEWEDEFGRRRRGTRAEKEKMERRIQRGLVGAEELQRMSARPAAPQRIIHGDTIQAMAFQPDNPQEMEELAAKRDRSVTPPDAKHYDADSEIRTKGTGFYKFSKEEEARVREMAQLEEERRQTEAVREARENQKEMRRREIEQRRREMHARRAQRQADSFLNEFES